MRKIHQFSLESEQLRLQSDAAGPQDELEYWKCRAAQLTLLVDNISSPPAKMTLATLKAAQSRILKVRCTQVFRFVNYYDIHHQSSRVGEIVNTKYLNIKQKHSITQNFWELLRNTVIQSILR